MCGRYPTLACVTNLTPPASPLTVFWAKTTATRGWLTLHNPTRPAHAVSRAALAAVLLRAALAAGVEVRFNVNAAQVETDGDFGCIRSATEHMTFDMMIIADGASSVLPAQAGLAVASTIYECGALWALFDVDHWPDEPSRRYGHHHQYQ